VEININHPIKLARIAMRALLGADKKGVVLMIASVAGLVGVYSSPLYSATKHAIVGFVKSMAEADEFEGVKVVAVCPGYVYDSRPFPSPFPYVPRLHRFWEPLPWECRNTRSGTRPELTWFPV